MTFYLYVKVTKYGFSVLLSQTATAILKRGEDGRRNVHIVAVKLGGPKESPGEHTPGLYCQRGEFHFPLLYIPNGVYVWDVCLLVDSWYETSPTRFKRKMGRNLALR